MPEFTKKIFSLILGMIIATLIIIAALWLINHYVLSRPPLKEKSTVSSSVTPAPEPLPPATFESNDTLSTTTSPSSTSSTEENHTPVDEIVDHLMQEKNHEGNPDRTSDTPAISGDHTEDENPVHVENQPSSASVSKASTKSTTSSASQHSTPAKVTKTKPSDQIGRLLKDIQSAHSTAEKAKESKSYRIQLGSYRSTEEASRQKAHLLILNIPINIVKAQVGEQVYYRVISAQTFTKEKAEEIKAQLNSQHINSIVIPDKK